MRAREAPRQVVDRLILADACQSGGGVTEGARYEDRIARFRTAAQHRLARRDLARHLHADDDAVSARRVPTHEYHIPFERRFAKAGRKRIEPAFIGLRERQGERHPARPRAHRSEVGQIHRDSAVADVGRMHRGGKVHACDDRVDHGDEFHARFRPQYGAIIADAGPDERRVFLPFEEAADQLEFIHWSLSYAVPARRHRGTH